MDCSECHQTLSKANWARHKKRHHPYLVQDPKGSQDFCSEHGLISRSHRKRHFDTRHNGLIPPGSRLGDKIIDNESTENINDANDASTNSANSDNLIMRYECAVKSVMQRALDQIRVQMTAIPSHDRSRLAVELEGFRQEMHRFTNGQAIGAKEYMIQIQI